MTAFSRHGPAQLPLSTGAGTAAFELTLFSFGTADRWVAAVHGDVSGEEHVPLRIESACVFGHVFGSVKCDCQEQLDRSLAAIVRAGRGLVIYGVDQDARGAGMEAHFEIYDLRQRQELDTEAVYERLGVPVDGREYAPVVTILRELSVDRVALMTNNQGRIAFLREYGIDVRPQPLEVELTPDNMGTLMLAKEDLDYAFSFRTHSEWLTPLQHAVQDDPDRRAARVVRGGRSLWEHVGADWDVAEGLARTFAPVDDGNEPTVLYLSDLPRLDELAVYAGLGVNVIVLPFAHLPAWLRFAGRDQGIAVQDWARANAYASPRPQWELYSVADDEHVYRRVDETRRISGVPAASRIAALIETGRR